MFIFSKARFEKGKTSKLPFIIHIPSSQKNFIGQQWFKIGIIAGLSNFRYFDAL
ncbi:hypothetical protein GILI108418_10810 [Gillisia limnaea]|uniref:Uncharacterized protein n=1 Tax=Gillisia limnaea (strain DSM 15749 / LMG 21470 / R-8282) TaxID=865937 RepID=H2BW56_GILLR|nr:hypothetical protein Gilli_2346 [Gillisia limnaea DSM 15749]